MQMGAADDLSLLTSSCLPGMQECRGSGAGGGGGGAQAAGGGSRGAGGCTSGAGQVRWTTFLVSMNWRRIVFMKFLVVGCRRGLLQLDAHRSQCLVAIRFCLDAADASDRRDLRNQWWHAQCRLAEAEQKRKADLVATQEAAKQKAAAAAAEQQRLAEERKVLMELIS